MSKGKGQKGISIFLRVRPTKKPSGYFNFDREEGKVDFEIPVEQIQGHVNNTRQNYKFKFNGLFDMKANQEEVFDGVAVQAVTSALAGFNSTIFAYGQTGSGKTFTITGGAERYVDRGIIPRALSYIFNESTKNSERKITLYISYMEIYNETAYDLLDPSHETKQLEDLPRVNFMEDDDGNVHLRGLTMHVANNEEEALNLLFLGDTNRAISETPMNMASSRSHCVFSISVESREAGSDVIRRSKLHIVDLAGSERAHKTGARGQILREAKFINTSLHYLEMVIVALHERKTKGRTHVPYRNSLMTSLLRDSLGGNCHTTMIATISAEKAQTEESISTCRFAQRVALVQNEAYVNEEVDPASVIQRLKAEVKSLKEEVNFLKRQLGEGDEDEREMAGHEIDRLRDLVQTFFDARESDPNQPMGFGGNPTFPRIQMALKILRDMVAERGGGRGKGSGYGGKTGSSNDMEDIDRLDAEIAELKELLAHRDNEISILVNMVKQGKTIPADGGANNSSNNNNSLDDMLKVHPQFLNVGVLTSILAAGPLNEFALFDVDGEAVGCGYFPLAAMANHSCIPTASVQMEGKYVVLYATRNLEVGEEITQSYANLGDDGRLTRMENIEVSWGFTCSCLRCKIDSGSGGDESSCNIIKKFDEANVCVCGGVIVPKARQGKREDDECKCNSYNLIV